MKVTAKYELPFRRRLENKTDYRKRLALLKSGKPRLVVRKSLSHIRAQIIDFTPKGDKVLASASSEELKKFGWSNTTGNVPTAYLVGLMVGKRALEHKVNEVIFDVGLYSNTKASRINSVLKGAIDAGLIIPHSEEILPSDDRIRGKHIMEYAKIFGGKQHLFTKNNPEKLEEIFVKIKSIVLKGEVNEKSREEKVERGKTRRKA